LEDTGKAELDIDQAEDENMDIRYILQIRKLLWNSCKVREQRYDFGNCVTTLNRSVVASLDWSSPSPSRPRLPVCSPVQSDPPV